MLGSEARDEPTNPLIEMIGHEARDEMTNPLIKMLSLRRKARHEPTNPHRYARTQSERC